MFLGCGSALSSSGRWLERFFPDGSFHNGLGQLAAFATLCSHAQLSADISKGCSATHQGFLDLAVSDGFTETDVHGMESCLMATVANTNVNENQCQQIYIRILAADQSGMHFLAGRSQLCLSAKAHELGQL